MPSKTLKQRRFMAAASHSADFADKAHIPQSVAEEFNAADQRMAPQKHGYLKMPKGKQ